MGRWRITVDGVGSHHNGKREIDANLAAADFVAELKAQGHTIEAARFEALGKNVDGTNDFPAHYNKEMVDESNPTNIDFLAPVSEKVGSLKPIAERIAENRHAE